MTAERETFVNQVVELLTRQGWRELALVALHAGRPFAFLGGQLLWVAQPALSLFISSTTIHQTVQLLEEPTMVAALIAQLEANEA